MANDQVSVEISIEEKAALRALTALSRGVDSFEKNTINSVKKTDAAWGSFKGNLAAIATSGAIKAITSGLGDLVTGSIEAAASAEKINTQLEVLTGSADKAGALFKQLTEYSAGTPFQLQGIAEASAQLLSFGFEAETVQGRIAKIGEVAAGSGSDLKEVALIYGQVAAAGKLSGERLLQLQERAVPIGAALAKTLGVAESEVKNLVSSGVVGFNEFEQAFNSLSDAGGLFEGAVKKQSMTLSGVVSTLKDNFFILQQTIGDTFRPDLVEGANVLIGILQDFTKTIVDNKDAIKSAIGFVKDYIGVYSEFALEAVKVKTPLEELDAKLAKLIERQETASKTIQESKESMGSFFGVFDSDKLTTIKSAEKNVASLETQIKSLLDQRKQLTQEQVATKESEAPKDPTQDPRVMAEEQVSQQILEQRRQLQLELELLEQESLIKEQERKLAQSQLGIEERTLALETIKQHEMQKAEIAAQIQAEKDSKIRDADAKKLADLKTQKQKEIATEQAAATAKMKIQEIELAHREKMVSGFGVALSQAASLAKKGTAEQKALAVAAATINTYAAATRAFRDYPYPANIAVMATTIASGLAQVSQIQKQSFATGGVFGGFNGASMGGDNSTANVRTGEMILNANQQRQLFDVANGRNNATSEPKTIEITSIVQVDEREIARAVRNQRLNGFNI